MNLKVDLTEIADYPVLGRLGLFLLTLLIIWLPIAITLYLIFGAASDTWIGILLYCLFVALIWFWGRKVEQKEQPYAYYGLINSRQNLTEWLTGIAVGMVSFFLLMETQVILGWQAWQPNVDWIGAVLPRSIDGIGIGFAEELLFRGWLLTELEKNLNKRRSLIINSSIFAITHFIKSEPLWVLIFRLPQFPGLMLLGMDLIWARRSRQGRLGLAMGLHSGLVWGYLIVSTTHWTKATGTVAEWITGIGGNPLAGMMALIFLGAIALGIKISTPVKN